MDTYTVLWIGWLLYFAIVEGVALKRTPNHLGTFSANVWLFFAVADLPADSRRWVHARRLVLLGTVAWLFAHFVSGGRFP